MPRTGSVREVVAEECDHSGRPSTTQSRRVNPQPLVVQPWQQLVHDHAQWITVVGARMLIAVASVHTDQREPAAARRYVRVPELVQPECVEGGAGVATTPVQDERDREFFGLPGQPALVDRDQSAGGGRDRRHTADEECASGEHRSFWTAPPGDVEAPLCPFAIAIPRC